MKKRYALFASYIGETQCVFLTSLTYKDMPNSLPDYIGNVSFHIGEAEGTEMIDHADVDTLIWNIPGLGNQLVVSSNFPLFKFYN